MLEIAKVQSTGASNRIEGVFTSDARLAEIVRQKVEPRNRSEKEIAGYQDVLATIHESYEHIALKPSVLLQLHRDLYQYSGSGIGGHFKGNDNVIEEIAPGGAPCRLHPMPRHPPREVPKSIEGLAEGHRVFLLANHGVLTWGRDLSEAYSRLETVKVYASILIAARAVGEPQAIPDDKLQTLYPIRESLGLK